MNRERLLSDISKQHVGDMELLKAKNHDYAGGFDALENLRDFGFFGIVVRLSDKFKRLKNFVRNGQVLAVQDESITETLSDIRNYAHLAEVMFREEQSQKKAEGGEA
jgi:hypothetical protein